MLTDELLNVAPSLHTYIEAMVKALHHFLSNVHLVQDSSSSQDLLKQVAMIFLTSANITSDDIFTMMSGDISGLSATSLTNVMRQAVKLMIDLYIFGDAPMVYHALEQFLASNDTNLIVQKVDEMFMWLASTQASGLDLLTQALPKIYDILRSILSALAQTVDMPADAGQFEDLARNIIAMLRQLVTTGGLLPPMQHQGMFQLKMMGGNHSMKIRNRREAPLMPTRDPMDDFVDLFNINYPALFHALSVPPTTGEVMETVHMFFTNPDLSVVLNGVTSDMPWGLNASREETINAVLGVLSAVTLPGALQM